MVLSIVCPASPRNRPPIPEFREAGIAHLQQSAAAVQKFLKRHYEPIGNCISVNIFNSHHNKGELIELMLPQRCTVRAFFPDFSATTPFAQAASMPERRWDGPIWHSKDATTIDEYGIARLHQIAHGLPLIPTFQVAIDRLILDRFPSQKSI